MTRRKKNTPSSIENPHPTVTSVADLARYLGLSDWTVSRALNGHSEVNIKTRERVEQAVEKLGFRPNLYARGLRGKGSGMVGVCISGLYIPVLNEKIYHLQESLRKRRLRSLLEITLHDKRNEFRTVADFIRIRTEGIVFLYSKMSASESSRVLGGMAAVHIDPQFTQETPSVSLDRRRAMQLLIDHLWSLGHRKIALVGADFHDLWRYPALAEYVDSRGFDPADVLQTLPLPEGKVSSIETGRFLVQKLISESRKLPTAVIALNDLVAFGALQALKDAGIDVPGRVSVTGFDNIDVAAHSCPRLTTIDQNPEAVMERAAAMLAAEIARPAGEKSITIHELVEPFLIVGESTGPARSDRR